MTDPVDLSAPRDARAPRGGSPAGAAATGAAPAPVDDQLVALARAGCPDAFALLVRRHRDRAYQVAVNLTGSAHDAEDVLQESLLQAWRALPGFRGDAAFGTWLHRIVTNRARNRVTRSRRWEPLSGQERVPADDGPDRLVEARERAVALRTALRSLRSDQRGPLVLYALDGCSYQEIAVRLGVSVPSVKGRIHRARRELARTLRDWR